MPGKVKVKIISGRNLPVMDRSSDTTDAYVEIKLGSTTYKTDVCRKSLHPHWNSDWYRFEVDDSELQDEPLQIRLMDHDTYSANDAIGKVYLDLNPLLLPAASLLLKWNGESSSNHETPSNSVMSGWIPVYDTMHGIRGEVNLIVKVELFSDFNKFRQSSCGVQFFCSPVIPHGFFAQVVHGFVEELVVNDDPEYQWIDKIRTPRASNEARQTLFFKLSGELQRKIGVKALDLGGNAVIGYIQSFDLEGESGIVARGIGTAVTLVKMIDVPTTQAEPCVIEERALSYLKFLGSAKGFFLNSPSNVCLKKTIIPLPVPSPSPSIRSLRLDDVVLKKPRTHKKSLTRHLSDHEFNQIVRPQPEILHHSTSLQTLLKQEDKRGSSSYGIRRKIKNLKLSSHNMISKKINKLKNKLSEAQEINDNSDTIEAKKHHAFKYRRTQSDSTGMAEILVRSVFQAGNSLDCIVETHDSPSPSSISRRISEHDENEIDLDLLDNNVSNSYLSLPDTSIASHSSNASSSSSDSTSLDDEDASDDIKNSIELDTVSHIVETVRKLSMIHHMENNHPYSDDLNKTIDEEIEETKLFVVGDDDISECESVSDEDFNTSETLEPESLVVSEEDLIPPSLPRVLKPLASISSAILLDRVNLMGLNLLPPAPPASAKIRSAPVNSDTERNQSFFPQITKTFETMKKSPSLAEMEIESNSLLLSTKFVSLHNIHDADSKFNNYSVHKGKETVLAHLFTVLAKKEALAANIPTEVHDVHEETIQEESEEIPVYPKPVLHEQIPACEKEKHGIFDSLKKQTDKILHAPKVLFHRLDSKIHHKPEEVHDHSSIKHHHGLLETALGNVLMESVNDILATSHSDKNQLNKSKSMAESPPSKPSLELIIPDSDLRVLENESHPKKELAKCHPGLLEIALGNVLMETVNDVLATSHSDSIPKPVQTENEILLAEPIPINTTNDILNKITDSTLPKTVNTQIDTAKSVNTMHACLTPSLRNMDPNQQVECKTEYGYQRTDSYGPRIAHSPAKLNAIPCIHRRSSDSDLSITPKGNSLTGSDRSGGCSGGQFMRNNAIIRSAIPQETFDIMEYPFLTMSKYPPGFIAFIGGAVSARSVKLLERITNIEEPESRDTWWSEIRMEIRSHARALNCNSVLGYTETTSICEDVCVLSASGTAAVIGFQYAGEGNDSLSGLPIIPKSNNSINKDMMTTSLDRNDFEKDKPVKLEPPPANKTSAQGSPEKEPVMKQACSICHLPYVGNAVPLRNSTSNCSICRQEKVPDILIATVEIPDGVPSIGRGCFLQSYVCRPLRDLKGESNAKEISDGLPFLEYELHRLLINKLKVKGMNAIFGLKVRISIGERMLIGIATGTAVYLSPLPPPPLPKLVSDRSTDEKKLAQLQKLLHDTVKKNKEIYQIKTIDEIIPNNNKILSDTDDSEDELTSLDLSVGNKDCCILEVDDPEDVDVFNSLMEPRPPDGFHVVNTELVPGLEELEIVKNLQMFTQIWRAKIQPPYNVDKHFHRLLQSVYFKLRRMIPCALCDLQFRVDSPEPDEIQLCVLGMALGLGDPQKNLKPKRKPLLLKRTTEDDLIFNLDEDQIPEHSVIQIAPNSNYLHTQNLKHRQKSPVRNRFALRQRHVPYRERHGVDITPLSYVPGGKIERYLGNLNFFFIRETTSIREEGGLSGFIHSFITEVLAIVRAHVTALGGNAMVAYFITECVLHHNLHKNQGQCLINVGGDVVFVSYFAEDH